MNYALPGGICECCDRFTRPEDLSPAWSTVTICNRCESEMDRAEKAHAPNPTPSK